MARWRLLCVGSPRGSAREGSTDALRRPPICVVSTPKIPAPSAADQKPLPVLRNPILDGLLGNIAAMQKGTSAFRIDLINPLTIPGGGSGGGSGSFSGGGGGSTSSSSTSGGSSGGGGFSGGGGLSGNTKQL